MTETKIERVGYVVRTHHYGRIDRNFQISDFTRDLAAALGCSVIPDADTHYMGRLDMGGGVTLYLRPCFGAATGRVELSAGVDGERHLDHYDRPKLGSITIDSARDMAAIAKDIRRRLVPSAVAAVGEVNAKVAAKEAAQAALDVRLVELLGAYPTARINRNGREDKADIYFSGPGGSLSARISSTTLYVDRCDIAGVDRFAKLLALISEVTK